MPVAPSAAGLRPVRHGRRALLGLLLLLTVALPFQSGSANAAESVRIGLTPVFLDDQTTFLQSWREYLQRKLGQPVEFVRRASYAEVVALLRQGKLDFAWLCGFPFVTHRDELDLLAVPIYRGRPLYQAYLIVPVGDERTQGLAGLKHRVFAFSDPNSNSGYLVPMFELSQLGERGDFFRKTFFTGSHRAVIEAVASRLADGGSVDGYVYDALGQIRPEIVQRTRIVQRSAFYGFPPIVFRRGVPAALVREFRRVLTGMSADADGQALLQALFLDGFSEGQAAQFDDIARMVSALRQVGSVP